MTRICPFCKLKLGSNDKYFCTSCGNSLPVEQIEPADLQEIVGKREIEVDRPNKEHPKSVTLPKSFKLKVPEIPEKIAKLLLIGFSILGLTLVIRFMLPVILTKKTVPELATSKTIPENTTVNSAVVTSKYVVSPPCSFVNGPLFDPNLGKLVPYEVDLYTESNDSENFLKEIVVSGIVSDSGFNNFYTTQKNNFIGSLGFFVTKAPDNYIYGIVFMLKDLSNKDILSKEFNVIFKGSYAVLVTERNYLGGIEEVGKGLEKNLTLNPAYASAKSLLPKEGKLAILPITKNGKGFMYQLLDKKLTENMSSLVNSFLDSKIDYAVVL